MKSEGLVVSIVDQPMEPGARSEGQIDWHVPNGWETEVLLLPEGTHVPLDLAITTIDDGVLAEVSGNATLQGECVRCLDPVSVEQNFSATAIYLLEPSKVANSADEQEIEGEGDEMDAILIIDRNTIDLEPIVRDALLGEAPLRPVCNEDCLGICVHCGVLLRDAEPGHKHEFLDPRFAALQGFFGQDQDDQKARK